MALTVIGISIGLLLFLLAGGLTLIFGLLGVINFGHGAFYMLGAYIGYQVVALTGSFWLALVAAPFVLGVLGAAVEKGLLRPVYQRPHAYQLLMTFGIILVAEEVVRFFWGLDYKRVAVPEAMVGTIDIAGSPIGLYRLFVCLAATVVAAGMMFLLERTVLGAAIRAAASNPRMLSCMGADVDRIRMWTFAGGTALAGLAGILAAPLVAIDSSMGVSIIVDCFVVIVLGGLGNIRGAVIASLLIGLTRALGQQFAPEWIDVATYGMLVITLLIRPNGLFNKKMRTA